MKILKKYEERLDQLVTQKALIEKEIEWVKELLENLRKEAYKTDKLAELRPEPKTAEFANLETAEAALLVLRDAYPGDMHQKEIARELFRRGWKCESKTPDQTVATTLYRLIKKGLAIEKTGKGTFRLTKPLKDVGRGHKEDEEEIPF